MKNIFCLLGFHNFNKNKIIKINKSRLIYNQCSGCNTLIK